VSEVAAPTGRLRPWAEAWQDALYGEEGFYRRDPGPVAHFRTAVHASALLAEALSRLARRSGLDRLVDVGAGRGELLAQLAACDPRLRLVGVDVVSRPTTLPDRCGWVVAPGGAALPTPEARSEACRGALVVAHEWLDVVPCPVLEVDDEGVCRVVEVAPDGRERLGAPAQESLGAEDLEWVRHWWPVTGAPAGTRVELGRSRDAAWADLVRSAPDAVLLAVDYAHEAGSRPPFGSLAGFRDGRPVPPTPDGRSDVTAHVALDAVAAAGEGAGARGSVRIGQRAALRALGVSDVRPPVTDASRDPLTYLAALQRAGEAAELLAEGGLGGFAWLLQSTGPPLPLPG